MPCYRPLLMLQTDDINPDTGKPVYKFIGYTSDLLPPDWPDREAWISVPCNRCIGCRLDYARQWSNRLLLELMDNPDAIFVTLTYDDEHLPIGKKGHPTVDVRDCQLFMKKLRKKFSDKKIRFFLASEYGTLRGRPHYHAILFGLSLNDFPDLELQNYNKLNQPLYKSDIFASIWANGFCTLASVSQQTCSYTARYMLKKLKGDESKYYSDLGIKPEFTLSSRRPGIGLGYFDKHPHYTSLISVNDGNKVVSFPMPKKLFNKIESVDPDLFLELKAARRETAYANQFLEWQRSDLEYLDFLKMKESELYKRIKGISAETRLDL